jgi:hypothetical protein
MPSMFRYLLLLLGTAVVTAAFSLLSSRVQASGAMPRIELSADNIGPRPIEDLTEQSITRDYAFAWKTMTEALHKNRVDLLDGYFTGFAKDNLSQLIAEQKQTGIRIHYDDRGHKLDAFFYSPNGDAMQLRDRAQVEIQVLDGDKVIHREQVSLQYMVLMTPGADRWLVRDLETTSEAQP